MGKYENLCGVINVIEELMFFCGFYSPFQFSVTFHIEHSHLICSANQMTGFYMKCNAGLKRVKRKCFFSFVVF